MQANVGSIHARPFGLSYQSRRTVDADCRLTSAVEEDRTHASATLQAQTLQTQTDTDVASRAH